jgi:hypothetical protein
VKPFRHGELVDALNTLEDLKDDVFRRGRTVSVTRAQTVEKSWQAIRQLVEAVDNTGLKIGVCVACGNYMLVPTHDEKNWACQNCSGDPLPPGFDASEPLLIVKKEVIHGS